MIPENNVLLVYTFWICKLVNCHTIMSKCLVYKGLLHFLGPDHFVSKPSLASESSYIVYSSSSLLVWEYSVVGNCSYLCISSVACNFFPGGSSCVTFQMILIFHYISIAFLVLVAYHHLIESPGLSKLHALLLLLLPGKMSSVC